MKTSRKSSSNVDLIRYSSLSSLFVFGKLGCIFGNKVIESLKARGKIYMERFKGVVVYYFVREKRVVLYKFACEFRCVN